MNINEVLHDVRQASRRLALLDEKQINEVLLAVADAAVKHSKEILIIISCICLHPFILILW